MLSPGKRLTAIILTSLMASCVDDKQHVSLVKDGVVYAVPTAHMISHTNTPHQFIRIKHPDRPFELAFDSRSAQRTAPNGWPVIFSLNDGTAPNVDYVESAGHKVVCRRAPAPVGGCGFRMIVHAGDWSVLFPPDQLANIGAIRSQAARQLETYWRNSRSS